MEQPAVVIPAVQPPVVETKPEVKPEVKPDLITRVASFKKPEPPPVVPTEEVFDYKEIENIPDPALKEKAVKMYKSFQRGFGQKFQELAELRKQSEKVIEDTKNWTPERVQSLLNDPNFVSAAKTVANPPTQQATEDSWMSEQDKLKLATMENELIALKRQSELQLKAQEDADLKQKYPNYAPDIVDLTIKDLVSGKERATREYIWKAKTYDEQMQNAYELGRQDERELKQEKITGLSSVSGTQAVPRNDAPKQESGENDNTFFRRLYLNAVARSKESQVRK